MFDNQSIKSFDHDLWSAVVAEEERQEDHIELIASENYVSPRILKLQGSVLTNKYAEGYPGKRYYGGCEFVDKAEVLAIERAKALFKADYANVQPHSGSQANAAAYFAMLEPGDSILAMDLSNGGHLTHGAKVNFSGKVYHAFHYGLDARGYVDYEQMQALAREHKPKLLIGGFSAYSRVLDWARMRAIADEVGAFLMADIAHVAGLVAAGLYPSPLPYADVVTTTTHKTLRGPRSGLILAKANPDLEKKLNSAIFPGSQGGPLMHVIAAKAMAFKEAQQPEFVNYQKQVLKNAQEMAKVMMARGYELVSGGTENHMFLVSLINKEITGKEAEAALGLANITVNKNTVPNEPRSPFVTSGLRIGTPAVTTRGFKEAEVAQVASWICDVLDNIHDLVKIAQIKQQAKSLCQRFPVYSKEALLE